MLEEASTNSTLFFALVRACKSTALTTIFLVPSLMFAVLSSLGIAVLYKETVPTLPWGRVLGYLLGFSAFGACLGLLAGWPQEPLIDKLLSPFLAFFTAFVTYLTSKETSDELRLLLPGSVIAFLVGVLFSYFYVRFY